MAVMGQAASLEGEVLDPDVRAFVLSLANDTIDPDTAWVKAVATVVAKKAPAEWTDDDLLRFQRELHQHFAAFRRLVALHADHRAGGGGPFDAYRVTVTRSDGVDQPLLVGVDEEHRIQAEATLENALQQLTNLTRSSVRAHHALLALLSERLLQDAASVDPLPFDAVTKRASHG